MRELVIFFTIYPSYFLAFVALIGLIVGSFLNVVIYRIPVMLQREWRESCQELLKEQGFSVSHSSPPEDDKTFNLLWPRSCCPHCQTPISAWQNIPILSYLVLRGRCHSCKSKISIRYPFVELLTAACTVGSAIYFGVSLQMFFACILLWALIALTFIDIDHQLLPDNITFPLLWLGILVNYWGIFVPLEQAIIGTVVGYLSLWTVYWGFKLLTGKDGMGYGDFKLLAVFGAWLGWKVIPIVVLLSSLVGATFGIALMLVKGHTKDRPIPFGPYLAMAGVLALFWGDTMIAFYLSWIL